MFELLKMLRVSELVEMNRRQIMVIIYLNLSHVMPSLDDNRRIDSFGFI